MILTEHMYEYIIVFVNKKERRSNSVRQHHNELPVSQTSKAKMENSICLIHYYIYIFIFQGYKANLLEFSKFLIIEY